MGTRKLKTLANAELSQIFRMRSRQLEKWLAKEGWKSRYGLSDKLIYYPEAKSHSLLIVECLIEIEARTVNVRERDKPYLAAAFWENKTEIRKFETLTSGELSQIFKMRSHQLEEWLTKEGWAPAYVHSDELVHYPEAKSFSLSIVECLIEIEARTVNVRERDKPYLAAAFWETNDE